MSGERTYIMIKPDGVQRNLVCCCVCVAFHVFSQSGIVPLQVGEIIKRFETKGFKLVALKFIQPTDALLKAHYADLSERKFFPGLIAYMSSGPVVSMVRASAPIECWRVLTHGRSIFLERIRSGRV
jgi:nucleoside-diphosphate kinase